MRITYTGRQVELVPAQLRKLEAQCAKLGRMLDTKKNECEARVVLSHERHLHKAEVTVKYHDHSMVGYADDSDLFTAIHGAVVKLEKQALKARAKWRDSKRVPRKEHALTEAVVKAEVAPGKVKAAKKVSPTKAAAKERAKDSASSRVHRVDEHQLRKPMTLEEAMLEMDGRDYVSFLDAETGAVSVLVRRRDGHFDLVEA